MGALSVAALAFSGMIGTESGFAPHLVTADAQPEPTSDPAEQAASDLAQRLNVDRSAILVMSVEDVTWSDSSLGCPEPGRAYLQVLTPGMRIRLSMEEKVYEYHSGRGGAPIYCENPQPPVSGDSPETRPAPMVAPAPTPIPTTEDYTSPQRRAGITNDPQAPRSACWSAPPEPDPG
jgi:hypothetical protein